MYVCVYIYIYHIHLLHVQHIYIYIYLFIYSFICIIYIYINIYVRCVYVHLPSIQKGFWKEEVSPEVERQRFGEGLGLYVNLQRSQPSVLSKLNRQRLW